MGGVEVGGLWWEVLRLEVCGGRSLGWRSVLQNLLFQKDDVDDDDDDDDDVLGVGNWGLQGLKPKAEFLMLLCCEHDLQGLGFPVGAPKPSDSK